MNVIADGVSWLASQLRESAGGDCVYIAGAAQGELTAIPARPKAIIDGEQVAIIDATALDFLIETSELATAVGVTEPAPGHRVERRKGAIKEVYEVRPPDDNVKCFEPVDAHGILLRVHCKRVSTE